MSISPPAVFKCLGDETRARIMLLVRAEGELCVCELIAALDDSQPKISRHLALLRACGLLADRRQGQWVYYQLNPGLPEWVLGVLQLTLDANLPWVLGDRNRLQAMEDRPIRQQACC